MFDTFIVISNCVLKNQVENALNVGVGIDCERKFLELVIPVAA